METLREWDVKLKLVKTRRGAILYVIELAPDHFFIEQNPLKNSKYGQAYRKLKSQYEEFYMFWEIRNNRYTGTLLVGAFLRKHEIDPFITMISQSDEFLKYPDEKDEEERDEVAEHLKQE
ncbi:MAG: hypothetical protein GXN92_00315 [Candidatus Micrarchaeota archaeon]|nr:hypothetical protein [Candidatus Micrarchaeota archaeon]